MGSVLVNRSAEVPAALGLLRGGRRVDRAALAAGVPPCALDPVEVA